MKHPTSKPRQPIAAAVTLVAAITCSLYLTHAQARPPSGPSGLGGNPAANNLPAGQPYELGLVRDAFEAYRLLQLDGDAFFSKTEREVHGHYRQSYRSIVHHVVRERITMEQAQGFLTRLLEIGAAHADVPGETDTQLARLDIDIESAVTERVDAEKVTPEVNRIEWLMEEFVRFAQAGGLKSAAASRLERELGSLISEEESAKAGSNFRDRERRDLLKVTLETWLRFVRLARS